MTRKRHNPTPAHHAPGPIIELIDRYPHLFYVAQTWYRGEAFTRRLPSEVYDAPPTGTIADGEMPDVNAVLPSAVDLLNCYVRYPSSEIWQRYLWTADHDAMGRRVYIGGLAFGNQMEIHRHLSITPVWGIPSWA